MTDEFNVELPLGQLKEILDLYEHPELLSLTWDGNKLGVRSLTTGEISAAMRALGARAHSAEEKVAQLTADLQRAAVAATNDCDRLHNEIEKAHRRWWHGLIGLRWEMSGWSWDWRRTPL